MAAPTKHQIWMEVIKALGALFVALITTLGTIYASSSKIAETRQALQTLPELEKIANLPLGTIVSSMLAPSQFAAAVGDSVAFAQDKSKWVLADGRVEIGGSKYGALLSVRKAPDLRGMFLRGMNEERPDGDPDGPTRTIGQRQDDSTRVPQSVRTSEAGSHSHTVPAGGAENGFGFAEIGGGGDGGPLTSSAAGSHGHTVVGGDVETRPKNVSVFYYIKIN
jgi:hypothetical protein